MAINETAIQLKGLKDRKADLEAQLKQAKADIAAQEKAMAEEMIGLEMENITIGGYSYTLTPKTHYSCLAVDRDQAICAIQRFGYAAENVYSNTFQTRTFEKIIKEIVEMNNDELPEEFDGIVSVYEENGITMRKAGK